MTAPWLGKSNLAANALGNSQRVIVDAQGSTQTITLRGRSRKATITLQTEIGMVLFRKLDVNGLSPKDAESALQLWANESLPLAADQYALDSWTISTTERGMVAVPLAPLAKARSDLPQRIKHLVVPELCSPTDKRAGIVLWPGEFDLLVCLWNDSVLIDWQIFANTTDPKMLKNQTDTLVTETPEWIYIGGEAANDQSLKQLQSLIDAWPDAPFSYISDWTSQQLKQRFAHAPAFDQFIHADKYRTATTSEKTRLFVAAAALVFAGLFLIFSDLQHLEKRVESLKQQDMSLSARARRSEQVAKRSGDTLRAIYDLRAMTVERNGIMNFLKAINNALPPGARLEDISIERNGVASVNGIAQSEVDISTLLKRLNQEPLLESSALAFTQQDNSSDSEENQQTLIRFSVDIKLSDPLLQLPSEIENIDEGAT